MILHIYSYEGGVLSPVARKIGCPFCEVMFEIPRNLSADDAYRWLEFTHLLTHAEEIADYRELLPQCSRCQRYGAENITPSDTLHRKCFSAECGCSCSDVTVAPPTPKFEEAE